MKMLCKTAIVSNEWPFLIFEKLVMKLSKFLLGKLVIFEFFLFWVVGVEPRLPNFPFEFHVLKLGKVCSFVMYVWVSLFYKEKTITITPTILENKGVVFWL